jgi:tetratricopeptide (TPR) repeat protein
LVADKVDQRSVEAASALVSIYLNTNRLEEANAIFDKEGTSPLKLVEANDDRIKSSQAKLEVLRLNLRSKVMAASQGGSTLNAKDVESIVKQMQVVAGDSDEGSKLLTNSLLVLAKELQEQLASVKDINAQSKLASGIRVLMKQLADVSKDAGILDWSGTTLLQLADGLKGNPNLTTVNKELNQSASEIFTKMVELGSKDGEFLKTIKRSVGDIQYKQGLTYRAMGEYEKASDVLITILKANPNQLSAQIEAAKNYQEWGTGKDIELLKKSYSGSDFDPRARKILFGGGVILLKHYRIRSIPVQN